MSRGVRPSARKSASLRAVTMKARSLRLMSSPCLMTDMEVLVEVVVLSQWAGEKYLLALLAWMDGWGGRGWRGRGVGRLLVLPGGGLREG